MNQYLLLLAKGLHNMPKHSEIQTRWADVPSAVEIARSNVVPKREISIVEKF